MDEKLNGPETRLSAKKKESGSAMKKQLVLLQTAESELQSALDDCTKTTGRTGEALKLVSARLKTAKNRFCSEYLLTADLATKTGEDAIRKQATQVHQELMFHYEHQKKWLLDRAAEVHVTCSVFTSAVANNECSSVQHGPDDKAPATRSLKGAQSARSDIHNVFSSAAVDMIPVRVGPSEDSQSKLSRIDAQLTQADGQRKHHSESGAPSRPPRRKDRKNGSPSQETASAMSSVLERLDNFARPYGVDDTRDWVLKAQEMSLTEGAVAPSAQISHHPLPASTQVFGEVAAMMKKKDLLTIPQTPFSGDPLTFIHWKHVLFSKMKGCGTLSALDQIAMLSVQTVGEAHEMIENYSTLIVNPQQTLDKLWNKLNNRYAAPGLVGDAIRGRLLQHQQIKGNNVGKLLRSLADQCAVAQAHMEMVDDLVLFDYPCGQEAIVDKLPEWARTRWERQAHKSFKRSGHRPKFAELVEFIETISDEQLSLQRQSNPTVMTIARNSTFEKAVVRTLNVGIASETGASKRSAARGEGSGRASGSNKPRSNAGCPIHPREDHVLGQCPQFEEMSIDDRFHTATTHSLCFKCLNKGHIAYNCRRAVFCALCKSYRHHPKLHVDRKYASVSAATAVTEENDIDASDSQKPSSELENVVSAKTGSSYNSGSRSCARVLLVDVSHKKSKKSARCYLIIDDQSTHSFVHVNLLEFLDVPDEDVLALNYRLTTMDRERTRKVGSRVLNITIRSLADGRCFDIAPLNGAYSAEFIPDVKEQVARRRDVENIPELSHLAEKFEEYDDTAPVYLLAGLDSGSLLSGRSYGSKPPFAFETPVGFALVGVLTCNEHHGGQDATSMLCTKEHFSAKVVPDRTNQAADIFAQDPYDELIGLSVEDRRFLHIVRHSLAVNSRGFIEASLPFRESNPMFPDNSNAMFRRSAATFRHMKPDILRDSLLFMADTIRNGYAERVPCSELRGKPGKVWTLPAFPIVHPRKKKVRVVVDASAEFDGVSLNGKLMSGPDTNNRLRAVLQKFREKPIGFATDVQQMFNSFHLKTADKDFLRFFWPLDSVQGNPLVAYRSITHTFGATSSPGIAILGMRYAAEQAASSEERDICQFVEQNFYMDDGMGSADTTQEAIRMLEGLQRLLAKFKIRAHKFVSSHAEVVAAFPTADQAADLVDINFDDAPVQHALGVRWNVQGDFFYIAGKGGQHRFSKRGVLATVNSHFDPIGIGAPVILKGRLIMREIFAKCKENYGWDTPIPSDMKPAWDAWVESLADLSVCRIPRPLVPCETNRCIERSLHGFADASSLAIGVVVYCRTVDVDGTVYVRFVSGESRVAPKAAGTIPRLELCACLQLAKAMLVIKKDFAEKVSFVRLHTDSSIALGYITNDHRRFSVYVANRSFGVRNISHVDDWCHVDTKENPADIASRSCSPAALNDSLWFTGPRFLHHRQLPDKVCVPSSVLPEELTEARVLAVRGEEARSPDGLFAGAMEHCSTLNRGSQLNRLQNVVIFCWNGVSSWMAKAGLQNPTFPLQQTPAEIRRNALFLLCIECQKCQDWDPNHPEIKSLDPFLEDGLLRVGGRMANSPLPHYLKHPILLPSAMKSRFSSIVIQHVHHASGHQGRHVTGGLVREGGYYMIHLQRSVRTVVSNCHQCRRSRSPLLHQKMAPLPQDRLAQTAPFTASCLDLCGPYATKALAKTRNTVAVKVWLMVVVCCYSRGVHVEVLPGLDTATFLNGLRRLFAIRGDVQRIYCDRGTNIVGAANVDAAVDFSQIESDLSRQKVEWRFHAPLASHHGGLVERNILSIQRVLDCTLAKLGSGALKYDEFQTLAAEAAAVVNSTPLAEVTDDPNSPPLTPSQLLTLKSGGHSPPITLFSDTDLSAYGNRRWKLVQRLADIFFENWRKVTLHQYQNRSKWLISKRSLKPGDVVLLRSKAVGRNQWPTGIIQTVKKSETDDLVRSVVVRVARDGRISTLERPVTELVLLVPHDDDADTITAG